MSRSLGGLVSAALLIILLSFAAERTAAVSQQAQPFLPPDPFVARLYYERIADLSKLNAYDLWEYNNLEEGYVLLSLTGAEYLQLREEGWQMMVDQEETAKFRNPNLRPFKDGYHTVQEIYTLLQEINQVHPDLTELVTYGSGTCLLQGGCTTLGGDAFPGYELKALRLSNETIPGTSTIEDQTISQGSKPIFFLMANIHARELTTAEIGLRMIDWLLEGYGQDADHTWLLDHHEIWIIPTANPEGHWMVELGTGDKYGNFPFYQRKNINIDADGDEEADCTTWPPSSSWQYGVDLNRNHSFAWGPPGSSDSPCSQTFRGPEPVSESETLALQELIAQLIPDQRGPELADAASQDAMGLLITLHSYGNLILWPWGFTDDPAPDFAGLKAIGDKMATYNGYLSCQPGTCLYSANGTTDDWVYGELGIPAFTYEIGDEFMPPYETIEQNQWPENQQAFLFGAKIARSPYQTILGPDTTNVTAEIVEDAPLLKITAEIDDGDHGGQSITGAQVAIDTPFWDENAHPSPMVAVDGSFDGIKETVFASIPLSELSPGRHIAYVRGQDAAGHWGVTSAVFVDISETRPFKNFFPMIPSNTPAGNNYSWLMTPQIFFN